MKNKLAIFSDSILAGIIAGFLSLVFLSFFIVNPIPKILISAIVSVLIFIIAQKFQYKKLSENLLKKQDKEHFNSLILYLKTCGKKQQQEFFSSLTLPDDMPQKPNFIFVCGNLNEQVLPQKIDDIFVSKSCYCIIITSQIEIDEEIIKMLQKNSNKKIEFWSYEKLYLIFKNSKIESTQLFEQESTKNVKFTKKLKTFASSYLSKKALLRLIFSAIIVFAYSYFVRYRVYYLTISIVLLLIALSSTIILISNKINRNV